MLRVQADTLFALRAQSSTLVKRCIAEISCHAAAGKGGGVTDLERHKLGLTAEALKMQ